MLPGSEAGAARGGGSGRHGRGGRMAEPARKGRILRAVTLALAVLALATCSDDGVAPNRDGPRVGDPEATVDVETLTVTAGPDGSAFIDLPARLGTTDDPPTLVCSYTPDGQNWWLAFGDNACFIERVLADGSLRVRIGGLEAGWIFRVDAYPQSS